MPRELPIDTTLEPCVFFLRFGDSVRIGHSTNLRTRLLEYRAGITPKPELLGFVHSARFPDRDVKRYIQSQWRDAHIDSDWFHATSELLEWIDSIKER